MNKDDVLNTLTKIFKDVNAVDPNLSDSEIGQIKLPELDIFKHELANDPSFKKEVLFKKITNSLKRLYDGDEPILSPHDETVFDRDITIDTLANEIWEDN